MTAPSQQEQALALRKRIQPGLVATLSAQLLLIIGATQS